MAIRRVQLQETLRDQGVESPSIEAAEDASRRQKVSFLEALHDSDQITPMSVSNALSVLAGLPVLEQIDLEYLQHELVRSYPLSMARDRRLLPLYVVDDQLIVGVADLKSLPYLADLQLLHGYPVRPVLVPSDVLNEATNVAYDRASSNASDVLDDVDKEVEETDDLVLDDAELLDDPNQAPIIRFVNAVLSQAIKERASDIHIEPYEKDLVVRYRIDGVLKEALRPPYKFKNTIAARIKIMAGLNIAEKRLPQDGRIRRKMMGREIDLRVSTVPVRHGERVVMRILEKGKVFSLDTLGMQGDVLETFRKLIERPHGILLVSGPTGSGKSTTLYSAITEINSPDLNILTIEDPVEYEVAGIGQVQVNHKIDLTFASALRSFLRQDPDVILVGEIRDTETANNAVQASLTGHMVFSTIHTNDAAGAFARLTEMGVEPFLVASSLVGVLAQRLVRRLCPHCKESYEPSAEDLHDFGVTKKEVSGKVYRARGCEECNHLGYEGRMGIYEFLSATDEVKRRVIANEDAGSIKRCAVSGGMKTLRDDGLLKVLAGETTFEEIRRVTADEAMED
jgi:general secretion pathway protein E